MNIDLLNSDLAVPDFSTGFMIEVTDVKTKFDEFTLDLKGNIIDANLSPESVTSYFSNEVIGKSIKIFYDELDRSHKIHEHDLQKAKARKYLTTLGQRVGNNDRLFWARMDFVSLKAGGEKVNSYKLKIFDIEGSLRDTPNIFAKYSISKLPIPTRSGYVFVELDTIIRCESDINYTIFHLVGGSRIIASKSMRQFEKVLVGANFFRIHKSDIINLKHIQSYSRASGGVVVMEDNSQLSISRTFKPGLITKLNINVFDKPISKI